MPGAVPFIPLIAAAGTAVAQNVQNKAAQKNNETQQQASVNNANQNWQQAQKNMAPWLQPNASPFAGATVAGPQTYKPGGNTPGVPVNVQGILQQYANQQSPQAPVSAAINPAAPALRRIMAAALGGS